MLFDMKTLFCFKQTGPPHAETGKCEWEEKPRKKGYVDRKTADFVEIDSMTYVVV